MEKSFSGILKVGRKINMVCLPINIKIILNSCSTVPIETFIHDFLYERWRKFIFILNAVISIVLNLEDDLK